MSNAPRVVMLVDNTVEGDSRVQKSARYMASLGWDVTLVGRSPTGRQLEEKLGVATMLRLPAPLTLSARPRRSPPRSLRRPLAYRDTETSAAAAARAAWRDLDLRTRLAGTSRATGALPRLIGKAQRVLHRTRTRQFKASSAAAAAPRRRAGLALHRRRAQWAYDDPFLADLELAVAPVLARLAPDLLHAHDFKSIGIAARYKVRTAAKSGATAPVLVYDAHEFLPGVGLPDAKRRRGNERYEAQHLVHVDGLVTVASAISEALLTTHRLELEPRVCLNVPEAESGRWSGDEPDIRTAAGVPALAPLLTYVGVAAEKRGITPLVDALQQLTDAHLVLVTKQNPYVAGLLQRASQQGTADRLHILPYVNPTEVSRFLRTADIGISMLQDTVNHQMGVPTKVFEYAHARLPIITSEVRASAELVQQHGIGLVTPFNDVDALVAAVRQVLADPSRFTAAYDHTDLLATLTWEAQCAPVDALYRELLGTGPSEADLLGRSVDQQLAQGEAPPLADLHAVVTDRLNQADRATDPKQITAAAASAAAALWHRTLHLDQAQSPLAADPGSFLEPWHASRTASRVAARYSSPPSPRPTDHVAVLSYKNMSFVPALERGLASLGRTSSRVDLADVLPGSVPLSPLQQIRARLTQPVATPWTTALDEALGAADTLWVDWGQRAAVAASLLPERRRRTIVRLHSFEAFSVFPHLVDWSAVDDLVFVGPHLRDLLVPQLRGFDPATTRTHVVPIGIEAARWRRPKQWSAARTLAVLGWAAPAKDATWAIELLAQLRRHDETFRLLLVGHEPAADGPSGVRQYRATVLDRLAQSDVAGAVELVPFTPDVSALLERVGVIVSSSVRESLHMAILEGAASHAVPVVRDWPMLARFNGPRRLFPEDWVVSTPEEGAARVLATTGSGFLEAGAAAAADAERRFGDDAVAELLRGVLES